MAGYVYALVNQSLNGLVKVGRTDRNPRERARELSSPTGVPTPFIVAYSAEVENSEVVERIAHGYLESRGYRLSSNREFFQAPIQEAINAIEYACSTFGENSTQKISKLMQEGQNLFSSRALIKDNFNRIVEIGNELVNLGACDTGYYMLGEAHLLTDKSKAYYFFQKAADAGNSVALMMLADNAAQSGEITSMKKHFEKLISRCQIYEANSQEINSSAISLACEYLRFCSENNIPFADMAIIDKFSSIKEEVVESIIDGLNACYSMPGENSNLQRIILDWSKIDIDSKLESISELDD